MQEGFYVYILKCKDNSYYTGHTDNIEKRISEHHLGLFKKSYAANRRPVTLVFLENFGTRDEAFSAERQIKGWSRKKKEALIKSDWNEIKRLNKAQKI